MDVGSFTEWYAGQRLVLLRFATVLSGDLGTAQDVMQEVAFRASRRWPQIQRLEQPEAYLRRMVINEHLSWRRKWGRFLASSELVEGRDRPGPDDLGRVDDRDQLRAGLAALSDRQRTVIVLRFYAGLTDAEIADVLGCPRGTVRSLQARALRTLRIELTESHAPVPPLSYTPSRRQES